MNDNKSTGLLGWREWVSLPGLEIPHIKAKVDTGAKTSALHTCSISPFEDDQGQLWVKFSVNPWQFDQQKIVECQARVKDRRAVTDSGGHRELRYVIESLLVIDGHSYSIELTLTDREGMRFRMLLGRSALRGRFMVDSKASFLMGGDKLHPPV